MTRRLGPAPSADQGVTHALQALDLAGQALELAGLAAAAAGYARGSKADNTRRAYGSDWAHFTAWCAAAGQSALPAEPATICLYLTAHAGALRTSTLRRRLACISQAHAAAGLPSPTSSPAVRAVWAGIARAHATPPVRKTPLVVNAMRAVLATLDDSPRGRRDRALLLLGWGGALRRGELVGLDRTDIMVEERGLVLTVRRSKTLRAGDVRLVGLPRGRAPDVCPAEAWEAWRACLPDRAAPAFRRVYDAGDVGTLRLDDRHVARLVKRVAARAGLEGDYSGHSLRSGLATSAAAGGAPLHAIMAQTGHRSIAMAQSYIRPATLFEQNAAAIAAL